MIDTNAVELTWTSFAFTGLLTQAFLLWRSTGNLIAVRRLRTNGVKSLLAWSHVLVGSCLITAHIMFATLGVRAIIAVDPPETFRLSLDYLLTVGTLMGASLALVAAGLIEGYVRRRIYHYA